MTRTSRYDWYGALIGLGLPLLGTAIEALRWQGSLGLAALRDAHLAQPLLWIMDTAPLVLGVLGRVIMEQQRTVVRQSEEIVRLELARRESFERTARELFHAAQGLLGNVSEFTGTTEETAASVRETTHTMNQLSQAASAAALTAETVIGLALQAERASAQGLRQAEASSAELLGLSEEVRGLSTGIEGLSAPVAEVLALAAVVARVSERTGRLAEAAALAAEQAGPGAGELGGLAGELRALSDEAGRAAVQVTATLGEAQRAMRAATEAARSGSERAGAGAQMASRTGEIIRGLAVALRDSARAAREIARVAQHQESGIEQVLKAMNEIAHATADTVQSTQHVEKEARSLNVLASSLRDAVKGE
jgi:methyl-accepting chemotaxis protein